MCFQKIFTLKFALSLVLLVVAYYIKFETNLEKQDKMASKFIKSDPKLLTVGILGYTGKSFYFEKLIV